MKGHEEVRSKEEVWILLEVFGAFWAGDNWHAGFSFQLATLAVLWKTDHGRSKDSSRRASEEAILVVWVKNVGYSGDFGTDGGGDM